MNPATIEQPDIQRIRSSFPILARKVHGKPLIYFDNAATTQKPASVIQAVSRYYERFNSNIHRGAHTLAAEATQAYENARTTVQHFINAPHREDVIFTRGVTESINLVAHSYGKAYVREGDEVVISEMEHHSNIVPWQMLCKEQKARLKVIPVEDNGEIDLEEVKKQLTDKTKIVALNHASNSLGTINPVKEIIKQAHDAGAVVLIDGAQAGAHLSIDVQALNADFYCLSAHKMYGPTGIGALYGKSELLEKMPPYMGGGEMIREVTFEKTTYNELPYKFEAGTPNIVGGIAFQEAISFINHLGKAKIRQHETKLLNHATALLEAIPNVTPVGTASSKVSVLSFVVEGIHYFDIGQMLDTYGIAVRTGHHCTQPLMNRLKIEGTVRASFAVYNTKEEIEQWIESLKKTIQVMK